MTQPTFFVSELDVTQDTLLEQIRVPTSFKHGVFTKTEAVCALPLLCTLTRIAMVTNSELGYLQKSLSIIPITLGITGTIITSPLWLYNYLNQRNNDLYKKQLVKDRALEKKKNIQLEKRPRSPKT